MTRLLAITATRTRHWVGACYGYGEFVTAHEATDSEHYIP